MSVGNYLSVRSEQQQYRQRFADAGDYRNALWRVLCDDFFQRYIATDATLLDLGCGWGEFSNNIRAGKKYAMDMNPDARARLNDDVELAGEMIQCAIGDADPHVSTDFIGGYAPGVAFGMLAVLATVGVVATRGGSDR